MIDIVYRFDPAFGVTPTPTNSGEARRRLEEGNRVFADLLASAYRTGPAASHVIPFDLSHVAGEDRAGAVAQAPFAVVLGCSDARVPTELVFGQAYNDLFVVRVAGNVLGTECLGSVDYAVGHLGGSLKLLVVVGHTGCGAVTAAVDAFLAPGNYLSLATSHALRDVVDRILVAVRAAARALETVFDRDVTSRPGYREALLDTAVVVHAALTAHTLAREFAGKTDCDVVYGIFDLATRRVGLPTDGPGAAGARLHAPPRDREAFVELLTGIASRGALREMLDTGRKV